MTRTLAPHGTANRYSSRTDPCRCEPCTKAASRAALERLVARQSGRPKWVPSGPALAHLAKLTQTVPIGQVALAADAPRSSLSRLLAQRRPTMSRTMAEKILAVRVVDRSTMSMVNSLGAQRRLQALYALGHWRKTVAEASGLTPQTISELLRGTWARITVACDDAVRVAYAQLSMSLDNCERNLIRARREQWAPPLAWDEETIDDPMALPALDAVPPAPAGRDAATRFLLGESVVLDQAARREVIGYLMEWSPKSPEEIGAQLEMSGEAVSRQWERMKARARETGERVPTRRLVLAGV
ncbi:hypothetical protein [Streptomyces sp. bgisy060]|uniref:hypothetical protein n=1 Tax=Streptomyces sp. bgisy060 TaxID=3413775 RepID=UPI003EC02C25